MAADDACSVSAVEVTVHVTNGRVNDVEVGVRRPADDAGRRLIGKTPDEAMRLAPQLFPVAAAALSNAAAAACERAMGLEPDPTRRLMRDVVAAAEALEDHARFLAVEWPQVIGETPLNEEYAELRRLLACAPRVVSPAADAFVPGGGGFAPDPTRFGRLVDAVVVAVDALLARLGEATEKLYGSLNEDDHYPPIPTLFPESSHEWYAARLAADPGFCRAPEDDGRPALNAPLAFNLGHVALQDLLSKRGLSPAPLCAARLVAALEQLKVLEYSVGFPPAAASPPRPGRRRDGDGCGAAGAAHGQLAVWVRLENGRIADWRSVTPTDWNFHPRGPVYKALIGRPADPYLKARAEQLAAALDPRMPWRVEVAHAAGDEPGGRETAPEPARRNGVRDDMLRRALKGKCYHA